MGKGSGRGGEGLELCGPFARCFEDIRNVICTIIIVMVVGCVLGIILTITGFSMWGSMFSDGRSSNIKQYNKDVSSWTNTYYTPFKNAPGTNGVKFNGSVMSSDTTEDTLDESDQSKLDSYAYLRYKINGALSTTTHTFDESIQKTLKFTVNGGSEQSVSVKLYGYVTENISSSCYTKHCTGSGKNEKCTNDYDSTKCTNACKSKGGANAYLTGNTTCNKQAKVSKVCVKMSESGSNFILDESWGGSGCFPSSYDSFAGYSMPAQYSTSGCTGSTNQCTWASTNTVNVYVREMHDPYVQLLHWNNGSTSFGLTTGQKFVYGLLLIIFGALCCMPTILPIIILSCVLLFCGAGAMAWYKQKTGQGPKNDHVQLQDDVENIQPLNPGGQGPHQGGYPPQQGGYPPQQGGFPPQQGGYPHQQGGYPPQQGGYPPQQGGYPPQQGGYPPQQGGYPPQQGGYPPQQGGYPPQQGGYPPQQGGYPPQQGGYPPQQGDYPQGAFPSQEGGLPPPTNPYN